VIKIKHRLSRWASRYQLFRVVLHGHYFYVNISVC